MNKKSIIDDTEISTGRLEALTDGVFAIAMTLLILEIKIPELHGEVSGQEFYHALQESWSNLFSFILSFIILGMFWVAHHIEFKQIKRVSNTLIWLNILYLMFISMVPFYAGVLGRFPHQQLAVVLYGLHLIWLVLIHFAIWRHVRKHKALAVDDLNPAMDRLVNRASFLGIIAYILGIALSFWNLNVSLALYFIIPLPYIFGWIYMLER